MLANPICRVDPGNWRILTLLFILLTGYMGVQAQSSDLYLIDGETRVDRIRFRGNDTIGPDVLREVIATQAPTGLARVPRLFQFLFSVEQRAYPFNPFEIQKDLIRIERFYGRQGFLHTTARYVPSYHKEENAIDILFTIDEGAPLRIRDVVFLGSDGSSIREILPSSLFPLWQEFRRTDSLQTGTRLSEIQIISLQQRTQAWLQDRGFAFARISPKLEIDSTANFADVTFEVNPGKYSVFGTIKIEGLESIEEAVVRRMLSFESGDPFSNQDLVNSKRRIFESIQFRTALYDVPDQPDDGSVDVSIIVREARLRTVSGSSGYSEETGLSLQGQWLHRDFFGDARSFSVSTLGELRDADRVDDQWLIRDGTARFSLGYRRPFWIENQLTFLASPFLERFIDTKSSALTGGLNLSLVYQLSRYRTLIFRNNLQRTRPFNGSLGDSLYNEVTTAVSGTFGSVDNFLNRSSGFLVTPFLEAGGLYGFSDVNYFKAGVEAVGYWKPLRHLRGIAFWNGIGLAGRLYAGKIWPQGTEKGETGRFGKFEDRYDRIRFYAGGSNDVRGWRDQWLGPKYLNPEDSTRYEPDGGLGKLAVNLELRLPVPQITGLEVETFFDAGNIWETDFTFKDFRYAVGGGVRYATSWSVFRVELAKKIRLDESDTVDPTGATCSSIEFARGCGRWRLIFGVTQAF